MTRRERDRLRDIKDAIAAIRDHLAGAERELAQRDDTLLHDALLFQFVVIGEAVKHLAAETRDSAPEIPWTNIAGADQRRARGPRRQPGGWGTLSFRRRCSARS